VQARKKSFVVVVSIQVESRNKNLIKWKKLPPLEAPSGNLKCFPISGRNSITAIEVHGAAKSGAKKKASWEIKNAENSRESGSEAEKQFPCS
jgi:hypothetical protein